MPYRDVLIVGGGPAGSTLAWALRQQGRSVAIIDKEQFPRDKVCAGWITPAVLQSLQFDTDEYSQENILQPIHGFRMGRISGNSNDINYPDGPVSYSIRRCEFDHYLLQRSDADVYPETKFETASYANGLWTVNESFSTPLLVGAGGHFCPVARQLGAKLGKAEVAVSAQEIEFLMTEKQQRECQVASDKPEIFFCDDLKGYGWVVRKGSYLNIGLGREDNAYLGEHVSSFCEKLRKLHRIPDDIPEKFRGHAYLQYPHAKRKLFDDGVLLIGDAAGLAYLRSGEGIRPAIESALLAAQVIRNSGCNYDKDILSSYQDQLEAQFGQRIAATNVNPMLTAVQVSLGKLLLDTCWFDRYVVLNHWFLHQQQPPVTLDKNLH